MTADFETGQRFGAYTLGKLLGRGGMGVVYQAQHVHLGRTVALKLLAPELSENEDFRARFLRESRLAAGLDHPGIVAVYDAGEVDGVLFIAMRFVRGTDLAALLLQRGPLPVEETLSILDQVATALDAAHAAGLVHRDVKPANVMIEGQRCYLADFGLTKRASSNSMQLTQAGQFLGTVDYVAPEQIEGGDLDGRADVYALGCVLFECLTGSRPYPRESQVAVLYAQLREPPPKPRELRPDLPSGIDEVVGRAMSKRPDDRYPSCGGFVAAARETLVGHAGAAATAPAAGSVERADTATRRVPTAPPEPEPELPTAPLPPPTPEPELPTAPLPPPTPEPELPTAPLPPPPPEPELPTAPLPPQHGPSPTPARRRSPVVPLVALGLLVAVAIVVALLVSGGGKGKPTTSAATPAPSPTPTPAPTSGPRVVGTPIKLGGHPLGVVLRGDALWVGDSAGSSVTRVAVGDGSKTTVDVGDGPFDLAGNHSSVWTANSRSNSASRIDFRSGTASPQFPVGAKPLFLTAEDKRVYVANSGDGSVTVLDARSGKQVGSAIPVGKDPRGITTGVGATWVTNRGSDTVSQIVNGRVLNTIPVGHQPVGVAHVQDSIWVTNEGSDTVSRIRLPAGSSPATETKVGRGPYGIAFGEGYIWITNRAEGSVMRLDPNTGGRVGPAIPVPGEPVSIATLGGSVWVTAYAAGTLTRIKP